MSMTALWNSTREIISSNHNFKYDILHLARELKAQSLNIKIYNWIFCAKLPPRLLLKYLSKKGKNVLKSSLYFNKTYIEENKFISFQNSRLFIFTTSQGILWKQLNIIYIAEGRSKHVHTFELHPWNLNSQLNLQRI